MQVTTFVVTTPLRAVVDNEQHPDQPKGARILFFVTTNVVTKFRLGKITFEYRCGECEQEHDQGQRCGGPTRPLVAITPFYFRPARSIRPLVASLSPWHRS